MWVARLSDGTELETGERSAARAAEYADGWIEDNAPTLTYDLVWRRA